MSRRSRRRRRLPEWTHVAKYVGLAVFAVAVGTFAGYVVGRDPAPPESGGVSYTPPRPSEEPEVRRVAFIGDSYTAGDGSTAGGFVQELADREGWIVENLGVGGTGYLVSKNLDSNYPDQIKAVAAFDPDVVIVSGGRNNVAAPVAELNAGVAAFFEQLRRKVPDAEIWAASPIWDDDEAPTELARVAEAVEMSVEAVGGEYLPLGQPLAGHRDWLVEDGVHPNDRGYRAIAEAILAEIPN